MTGIWSKLTLIYVCSRQNRCNIVLSYIELKNPVTPYSLFVHHVLSYFTRNAVFFCVVVVFFLKKRKGSLPRLLYGKVGFPVNKNSTSTFIFKWIMSWFVSFLYFKLSVPFLQFCCYLVWLFLVLLMVCVGFVVVDVFPFFVSSHSSTPDLEMTEKDSDAFIESVFDSLYKKCHPISLNVVFPKAAAQNDRALWSGFRSYH